MSSSEAESRPSPRKRARIASSSGSSQDGFNPSSSSSSPRRLNPAETPLAGSSGGLAINGAAERARARHLAARGTAAAANGVAFAGDVSMNEPEPTTEEGSADEVVLPFQPKASSTRAIAGPNGSKQPTPIVDLGDSSSSDDDLYAPGPSASRQPFAASSSSTRRGAKVAKVDDNDDNDDDDDIVVVTEGNTVNGRDKGKGKARAKSTTPATASASTQAGRSTSNGDGGGIAAATASAVSPPGSPPRTLAMLECPICCGPPTPLALTSCGHVFCAPCLHAALVAGPPLTPPPAGAGPGRGGPSTARRGGGGGRPLGMDTARLFLSGSRGGGGATSARGGRSAGESEDEGDPDLNKRCPLCRTPLTGGWGKSLRGLVFRMAPRKR